VASAVKQKIKVKADLDDVLMKNGKTSKDEVEAFYEREYYPIPVSITVMQCDKCAKKGTQYFEGILQLRNPHDYVFSFIDQEVSKVADKGIFINRSIDVDNGVDLYMTNKTFINNLARNIVKRFGGLLKVNPQLFSRNKQTSKNIYRLNVSIELPNFHVGDVVKYEDKVLKITSLGKNISGINLDNDKKIVFQYKKPAMLLEIFPTEVIKIKPEIEVIHPITYQAVPVKSKARVEVGQRVKVVVERYVYIV
jgi:nonsense-mediated mRNA decay protein 3